MAGVSSRSTSPPCRGPGTTRRCWLPPRSRSHKLWRGPEVRPMSRFVVGIDLGTTNCALASAEAGPEGDAAPPIRPLPVPQVVGANDVGERPVLPSFLYL